MERLRAGEAADKLDQLFVVATKTNGTGQSEYRGSTEALYVTKLRHRVPINGSFGPFWSLEPDEFEGEETPF